MRTSGGEARSSASSAPLRRGQSGQSLVEVIIALGLLTSIFIILAGALFAVIRVTTTNKNLQSIDTGLITYGEILKTQVPYENCSKENSLNALGTVTGQPTWSNYQNYARNSITGGGSEPTKWRLPYGEFGEMLVEVIGVESWNLETGSFEDRAGVLYSACLTPDTGIQRVSYRVTFGGVSRTGQVVKRKPCRSNLAAGCPAA